SGGSCVIKPATIVEIDVSVRLRGPRKFGEVIHQAAQDTLSLTEVSIQAVGLSKRRLQCSSSCHFLGDICSENQDPIDLTMNIEHRLVNKINKVLCKSARLTSESSRDLLAFDSLPRSEHAIEQLVKPLPCKLWKGRSNGLTNNVSPANHSDVRRIGQFENVFGPAKNTDRRWSLHEQGKQVITCLPGLPVREPKLRDSNALDCAM